MNGLYDVYILAQHRSPGSADEFLDIFAPHREQTADDYVFPPSSGQPEIVLTSASEAIRHCESNSGEEQSLYFRNLGPGPTHVMLFFTGDGGLILGLSVFEGQEVEALDRLRTFVGVGKGYIDFESPPPDSVEEFRRVEESHSSN
jgi:hypothetical protein